MLLRQSLQFDVITLANVAEALTGSLLTLILAWKGLRSFQLCDTGSGRGNNQTTDLFEISPIVMARQVSTAPYAISIH